MQKIGPDVEKNLIGFYLRALVRSVRLLKIRVTLRGKFNAAKNVHFGPGCRLMVPEKFFVKDNLSVGANFFVQTNAFIGEDCLISSDVSFVGHDHDLHSRQKTAYWSGRLPASTVILEGNNFIGYRATLVGSITVGKGAIVAAGAVVVKDVPPDSIVAGVPARVIRDRYK